MLMISSVGENESIKWYNYFGKLAIARKSYTYAQQMTQQCPGTLFFSTLTYYWIIVDFELIFNCGIGEDSWESLGLQGDSTSQS